MVSSKKNIYDDKYVSRSGKNIKPTRKPTRKPKRKPTRKLRRKTKGGVGDKSVPSSTDEVRKLVVEEEGVSTAGQDAAAVKIGVRNYLQRARDRQDARLAWLRAGKEDDDKGKAEEKPQHEEGHRDGEEDEDGEEVAKFIKEFEARKYNDKYKELTDWKSISERAAKIVPREELRLLYKDFKWPDPCNDLNNINYESDFTKIASLCKIDYGILIDCVDINVPTSFTTYVGRKLPGEKWEANWAAGSDKHPHILWTGSKNIASIYAPHNIWSFVADPNANPPVSYAGKIPGTELIQQDGIVGIGVQDRNPIFTTQPAIVIEFRPKKNLKVLNLSKKLGVFKLLDLIKYNPTLVIICNERFKIQSDSDDILVYSEIDTDLWFFTEIEKIIEKAGYDGYFISANGFHEEFMFYKPQENLEKIKIIEYPPERLEKFVPLKTWEDITKYYGGLNNGTIATTTSGGSQPYVLMAMIKNNIPLKFKTTDNEEFTHVEYSNLLKEYHDQFKEKNWIFGQYRSRFNELWRAFMTEKLEPIYSNSKGKNFFHLYTKYSATPSKMDLLIKNFELTSKLYGLAGVGFPKMHIVTSTEDVNNCVVPGSQIILFDLDIPFNGINKLIDIWLLNDIKNDKCLAIQWITTLTLLTLTDKFYTIEENCSELDTTILSNLDDDKIREIVKETVSRDADLLTDKLLERKRIIINMCKKKTE